MKNLEVLFCLLTLHNEYSEKKNGELTKQYDYDMILYQ